MVPGMSLSRLAMVFLCVLAVACGDDAEPGDPTDSGTQLPDGSMPEDSGMNEPEDAAIQDTGTAPEDAAMDSGEDSGRDGSVEDSGQDAGGDAAVPKDLEAVIGARCDLRERIGLITVTAWSEGAMPSVYGQIFDKPEPAYGAPALSDESCDFHRAPTGGGECGSCNFEKETCSAEQTCELVPEIDKDAMITLIKGASTQEVPYDENSFAHYVDAELAPPFALEVAFQGYTITMEETAIPSGLMSAMATYEGDPSAPDAMDISWSGATEGDVFTHVPMNHHVGGPTFTECAVEAASGGLHIDGDMLKPLSVVTGLEFQGIEHVIFGAAETAAGCIEIRYSARHFVL
jgi:hypothetical protein